MAERHKIEERPGYSRITPANPYKTPGDLDKNEKHWFTKEGGGKGTADSQRSRGTPHVEDRWSDSCTTLNTLETRRKFFFDNQLCYNCGRAGHPVVKCRSRGCYISSGRHHTCIWDKENSTVLSVFTPAAEELALPAITPVNI